MEYSRISIYLVGWLFLLFFVVVASDGSHNELHHTKMHDHGHKNRHIILPATERETKTPLDVHAIFFANSRLILFFSTNYVILCRFFFYFHSVVMHRCIISIFFSFSLFLCFLFNFYFLLCLHSGRCIHMGKPTDVFV